jgi:hypothetical protein
MNKPAKKIYDRWTGTQYPSQCAMVRAVFPEEWKKNHFYMYKAYKLFPGRFTYMWFAVGK